MTKENHEGVLPGGDEDQPDIKAVHNGVIPSMSEDVSPPGSAGQGDDALLALYRELSEPDPEILKEQRKWGEALYALMRADSSPDCFRGVQTALLELAELLEQLPTLERLFRERQILEILRVKRIKRGAMLIEAARTEVRHKTGTSHM